MSKKRILFIFIVNIFTCTLSLPKSNDTLWYNRPAEYFEEVLVLGNGKTGATVFGGVQSRPPGLKCRRIKDREKAEVRGY